MKVCFRDLDDLLQYAGLTPTLTSVQRGQIGYSTQYGGFEIYPSDNTTSNYFRTPNFYMEVGDMIEITFSVHMDSWLNGCRVFKIEGMPVNRADLGTDYVANESITLFKDTEIDTFQYVVQKTGYYRVAIGSFHGLNNNQLFLRDLSVDFKTKTADGQMVSRKKLPLVAPFVDYSSYVYPRLKLAYISQTLYLIGTGGLKATETVTANANQLIGVVPSEIKLAIDNATIATHGNTPALMLTKANAGGVIRLTYQKDTGEMFIRHYGDLAINELISFEFMLPLS